LTPFEVVEISRIIIEQCAIHSDVGLTPDKIMAVMERESAFNPRAISKARAYGLMQVIQSTFLIHSPDLGYGKSFSRELALDPLVNIQVGIRELVRLRKFWLSEDVDSWLVVYTSFFWGERNAWALLLSKKRARLPSLEYSKGINDLAKKWRGRGLS